MRNPDPDTIQLQGSACMLRTHTHTAHTYTHTDAHIQRGFVHMASHTLYTVVLFSLVSSFAETIVGIPPPGPSQAFAKCKVLTHGFSFAGQLALLRAVNNDLS